MKTLSNIYSANKKQNLFLLFLSLYCAILLLFRAKITQSIFYFFLIWNLFLAAIPYLILQFAKQKIQILENVKTRFILFISWLLFLPNSFYILTDFVHLKKGKPELFWFDLVLLFSFAVLGFLFGLLSLKEFKNCFSLFYSKKTLFIIIPIICFLSGFGVSLGRFLRFNSWHIITNPFSLILEAFQTLFTSEALLFSVLFGSLIYITFLIQDTYNGRL